MNLFVVSVRATIIDPTLSFSTKIVEIFSRNKKGTARLHLLYAWLSPLAYACTKNK